MPWWVFAGCETLLFPVLSLIFLIWLVYVSGLFQPMIDGSLSEGWKRRAGKSGR